MVFKKIIFQNRYVALETPSRPPPFMANTILNFHFDYLHTSLRLRWIGLVKKLCLQCGQKVACSWNVTLQRTTHNEYPQVQKLLAIAVCKSMYGPLLVARFSHFFSGTRDAIDSFWYLGWRWQSWMAELPHEQTMQRSPCQERTCLRDN